MTPPALDDLLAALGEAGARMSALGASEGAAGNVSVYVAGPLDVPARFPDTAPLTLPVAAPALAGGWVLVSGSGRRLRDLAADPVPHLGAIRIAPDGRTGTLFTAPARRFTRVTSEFNSHLAVHADQVARSGAGFHALIHAQPPYLVYLTHIPAYRDAATLNARLLRWQSETILEFPEGLGLLPFLPPSSPELMAANVAAMRDHRLVVWAQHGVMAGSAHSPGKAADLIEYAEAAARYEYLDLLAGGRADGLTPAQLRAAAAAYGVHTDLV